MIMEINARIIRTIIIHFTIVHAILPITARIKKMMAIMINNVKSQSMVSPIGNLNNISIYFGKINVIDHPVSAFYWQITMMRLIISSQKK